MHYYPRDIGKYRRKTVHLTLLEHGVYSVLLDTYYMQEGALSTDTEKVMRHHGIRTEDEKQAFFNVLEDFFILEDDGYHNIEADQQLELIYQKSESARKGAQARWKKVKPRGKNANASKNNANASESDANASKSNANGMPLNTKDLTLNTNGRESEKSDSGPLPSHDDLRFAGWMYHKILDVVPKAKEPNFMKWGNTVRLMRERDGLNHREMAEVFSWANKDDFWNTNILSPEKFRKQFAKLDAEAKKHAQGKPGGGRRESRSERVDRKLREKYIGDSPDSDPGTG